MHVVQEQVEQFGVAVIDCAVARTTIDPLIAALDGATTAEVLRRGKAFAQRNVLRVPAVRAFADGLGCALVQPVLGDGALAVRGLLFDKTADANWTVPWHQDRSIAVRERREVDGFGPWSTKAGVPHVQPPAEVLRQMLTLRLHLDDCGEENGPLRAVPGTHDRILDTSEVDQLARSATAVACATPAGGAVLMRPLALHASFPARRPGRRRVLHIEYAPETLRTLPGGLAWAFA